LPLQPLAPLARESSLAATADEAQADKPREPIPPGQMLEPKTEQAWSGDAAAAGQDEQPV
jgi:hypothetical protein